MGTRQPNPFPQLANVAADLAARDAFTAAVDAAGAAGFADEFINGAVRDYQALLKLGLGGYPEAGQPIDPSPAGPLGTAVGRDPSIRDLHDSSQEPAASGDRP